jgi:hypothetical protein
MKNTPKDGKYMLAEGWGKFYMMFYFLGFITSIRDKQYSGDVVNLKKKWYVLFICYQYHFWGSQAEVRSDMC